MLSARRAVAGRSPSGCDVEYLHVRRHPVRDDNPPVAGGTHVVGVDEQVSAVVTLAFEDVLQGARVGVVKL